MRKRPNYFLSLSIRVCVCVCVCMCVCACTQLCRKYRNLWPPCLTAGIFGYLNYLCPRTRHYILEALIKGLKRLEYRGYDSAGVAFDGDDTVLVQGEKVAQTR